MAKKFIFIFIIALLTTCSPYTVTKISVLMPGKAAIPSDVKTMSLAMIQNEQTMPAGRLDSINNLKLDPDFNYYMLAKDMLYGMREVLSLSPKFDTVIISGNYYFGKIKSSGGYNWNEIIRICRNDSTDALLVIENCLLKDTLNIIPFEESCFAEYRMNSKISYTIFYPRQLDIVYQTTENHSVEFSEIAYDCNMALDKLPDGGDLIVQLFYETGQLAVTKIAPEWQDGIKRVYYSNSDKLLRQGANYAKRDLWLQAADYWRKAVDVNKKNLSARATFNMAVVCEIENMPELAINWIEMSDSLKSTDLSRQYKKILNIRLKHYNYLDEQMGLE